ncbi:SagB/ThcOx family dehydrogenase [Candidatus Bipolaricaulota bacterium]
MRDYRKYFRNQALPGMSEMETDMMKGLPIPAIEKAPPEGAASIDLPSHEAVSGLSEVRVSDAIGSRRSRRAFTDEAIDLEQLAYLLWATQGVHGLIRDGLVTVRSVPSGGGMHPFETYISVHRVAGLAPGLYRYLAIEHKLVPLDADAAELPRQMTEAANGQAYVGEAAAVFCWAVRPYRTEYRYGDDSLKDILISVGHVCQNLYLACEALGLGTWATVAYQQDALDRLLGVDGYDEIPLYLAPVGRVADARL